MAQSESPKPLRGASPFYFVWDDFEFVDNFNPQLVFSSPGTAVIVSSLEEHTQETVDGVQPQPTS